MASSDSRPLASLKSSSCIRYESQLSEVQFLEGKCPGKAGMIPIGRSTQTNALIYFASVQPYLHVIVQRKPFQHLIVGL
jgi:hypothetical protein